MPKQPLLDDKSLGSAHVLVVEDEALILMDIELTLRNAGYRVTGVTGVDDAIAAMDSDPVDFALLDIQLVGSQTSYSLANLLRASGVPFAFASGSEVGEEVQSVFASVPFIDKPLQPASILAVLSTALAQQRSAKRRALDTVSEEPAIPTPATEIGDLISRVAGSDRAAFKTLYAKTSAKLFGVTLRMLRDRTAAEGALQDVYVTIWRRAERFRLTGYTPMGWLVAVTRNHCLDISRKRRPWSDEISLGGLSSDGPPMRVGEPSGVEGRLPELEPCFADAVRGAYLDGLDYDELAIRSSVSSKEMRASLRDSLLRLRAPYATSRHTLVRTGQQKDGRPIAQRVL